MATGQNETGAEEVMEVAITEESIECTIVKPRENKMEILLRPSLPRGTKTGQRLKNNSTQSSRDSSRGPGKKLPPNQN